MGRSPDLGISGFGDGREVLRCLPGQAHGVCRELPPRRKHRTFEIERVQRIGQPSLAKARSTHQTNVAPFVEQTSPYRCAASTSSNGGLNFAHAGVELAKLLDRPAVTKLGRKTCRAMRPTPGVGIARRAACCAAWQAAHVGPSARPIAGLSRRRWPAGRERRASCP